MKVSDALAYYGSKYKIAKALNESGYVISHQAIYAWKDEVPELQARRLEEITKGELKR